MCQITLAAAELVTLTHSNILHSQNSKKDASDYLNYI